MDATRGIAKLGFPRWYERHLMESHAWLVSCFLCLIGLTALFEEFTWRAGAEALLRVAAMFATTTLGWYALKRYIAIMQEAERFARRSICTRCKAYGAFQLLRERPPTGARCRRCGNEWTIE
jgi:hypothetical protein